MKKPFGSCFLFFNILTHSDGVKVSATNPEIVTDTTMVIANCLYISPLNPPIKATGTNTAPSTKIIAIKAPVTSLIAANAASFGVLPISICRSIFSITIIASSTTIPIARTSPKRVRRFILNPKTYIPANAPIIDTGTAISGIIVALQFCKNRYIINITKISASTNVLTTSFIEAEIKSVLS